MELRRYAAILRRAWWIVLGVPLLVLLASLPGFGPDPERYRVVTKFAVTQGDPTTSDTLMPAFNTYHSWQSSQYIIDDLPPIINSRAFAELVAAQTPPDQSALDPATVQAALTVEREHRIMSLIVDAPAAEQAQQIAQTSLDVLQAQGLALWNRSSPGGLSIRVLQTPTQVEALRRWPQPVTRLALRFMLGLVAGIGLAFLRHYLDRTVREGADLEQLQLPILARIPKE